MTIYEHITNGLKLNDKFEILYKKDIFQKSIVVKYVYINNTVRLNHIKEMENNDWFLINKNVEPVTVNTYARNVIYASAEFMKTI